jgi:hypothetical protein
MDLTLNVEYKSGLRFGCDLFKLKWNVCLAHIPSETFGGASYLIKQPI